LIELGEPILGEDKFSLPLKFKLTFHEACCLVPSLAEKTRPYIDEAKALANELVQRLSKHELDLAVQYMKAIYELLQEVNKVVEEELRDLEHRFYFLLHEVLDEFKQESSAFLLASAFAGNARIAVENNVPYIVVDASFHIPYEIDEEYARLKSEDFSIRSFIVNFAEKYVKEKLGLKDIFIVRIDFRNASWTGYIKVYGYLKKHKVKILLDLEHLPRKVREKLDRLANIQWELDNLRNKAVESFKRVWLEKLRRKVEEKIQQAFATQRQQP